MDPASRLPERMPPIAPEDRIVLFDGLCGICNGWARLLVRIDRTAIFRLAALQSATGRALTARYGAPAEIDSLLLVENGRIHSRSTAFIRVVVRLPFPWKLAALAWLAPRPLRDLAYDVVARNRHRFSARLPACPVPPPGAASRFLP